LWNGLEWILGVPDDIPQDLLDKADCVVVFPSVLKAAFIVGGSYGAGPCRAAKAKISADRGAPHDDGSGGGALAFKWWEATDSCCVMNEGGARASSPQGQAGGDASVAAGPVAAIVAESDVSCVLKS